MHNLYQNFFTIILLDSGHELMQKFIIFLKRIVTITLGNVYYTITCKNL